jgi:hypothetical protein
MQWVPGNDGFVFIHAGPHHHPGIVTQPQEALVQAVSGPPGSTAIRCRNMQDSHEGMPKRFLRMGRLPAMNYAFLGVIHSS